MGLPIEFGPDETAILSILPTGIAAILVLAHTAAASQVTINADKEAMLREVVNRFKDHPGLLAWKGVDEPEWGKQSVERLLRARDIIRKLDPNHPIAIVNGVEFCAREAGRELFILACKREGTTAMAEFSGLPASTRDGAVMFEPPRAVTVKDGKFSDWFAPYEVHLYQFELRR